MKTGKLQRKFVKPRYIVSRDKVHHMSGDQTLSSVTRESTEKVTKAHHENAKYYDSDKYLFYTSDPNKKLSF